MASTLIHSIVEERAYADPYARGIIDGDIHWNNREVARRVDALARALWQLGIRRGDRVATLAPPSADFWITYLATVSIGAIWQGLNPKYQKSEYEYLLLDARPSLVFVRTPFDGRDYLTELASIAPADTRLVALSEQPLEVERAFADCGSMISEDDFFAARSRVDPEDVAVIVYTSGSTGRPKGAMLSHRAIVATAFAHVEWIGKGLDCTLCPAPINHVGGLNNVCMTVFAAGGAIGFAPRVDFALLAKMTEQARPTYLVGSPTAFAMAMSIPGFDFSAWRGYEVIVFGGAATPLTTLQALTWSGARLSSVYGQTETTGMVTYTDFGAPLEIVAATIGRPIRGMEVRVALPDGTRVLPGETGEIQVRGISVMSGYFGKPEATREAFTEDGWLRTGDLGVLREDGEIAFAGRLKEMFKSGGYNCYPVEIELAICEYPDVGQAAVVSVPHPMYQEVGHAFLVASAGCSLDLDALRSFLKKRIANYKIPKTWEVVEFFDTLPNGKVDKTKMRSRLSETIRNDDHG